MELNVKFLGFGVCARYLVTSWQIGLYMRVWMGGGGGGGLVFTIH